MTDVYEVGREWDEPDAVVDVGLEIDFESDLVTVGEVEPGLTVLPRDVARADAGPASADPDLDGKVDAFVDLLNARDTEGLVELLSPDASCDLVHEASGPGLIEGLESLLLRYPSLLATRGEYGSEPIVALWLFDPDSDRYESAGFLTVALSDDGAIERLDHVEEFDDGEILTVEEPEAADRAQWEDWEELDDD